MKTPRIFSISLGCPKNRVDTERLLGAVPGGLQAAQSPEDADVVLINTCAFIAPAVQESVKTVLETAAVCTGRKPLFVVAGCLVARYGAELVPELPEVDLWLRPGEQQSWLQALTERCGTPPALADSGPPPRLRSTPPSYAYLKIGEGCNHACRYCTIPRLRGRLSSGDDAHLVREARTLLDQGVKELVLVAQDLTAHGLDRQPPDPRGLQRLLEQLLPLPGLNWLRLLYLYPAGLSEELLGFLKAAGPPFLPYFDIPFQHVHPEVLERMGRPKSEEPERIIERVRRFFPEAALRTTFIVGYPGETEEQFQALCDFVVSQRLQHVGVFAYQPEDGTAAAKLKGRIPKPLQERRRATLLQLQREISGELLESLVGERMEVLVDTAHEEWPGLHVGRVWLQAPEADGVTYVSGPGVRPGALVRADIMEAREYDLVALT